MKLQLASDLHLEFLQRDHPDWRVIAPESSADVLVLAGDIATGIRGIELFANWPVPVIYVAGNHAFYHGTMLEGLQALRDASRGTNVTFLENDEVVLYGVGFLGATLWTDYALYGNLERAMQSARHAMTDHDVIRTRKGGGKFLPQHARDRHLATRCWLEAKLAEPFPGNTVVVTHHGPHPNSIAVQYADDPNNAAYHSDLTPLMGKAALWVHGHAHASSRYRVHGTDVVANSCGYPSNRARRTGEEVRFENDDFDRALVLDVPSPPVVRMELHPDPRPLSDDERYRRGRTKAEQRVVQLVGWSPTQAARLVKMVFGNGFKLSHGKRKHYLLSDQEVVRVEAAIAQASSDEELQPRSTP